MTMKSLSLVLLISIVSISECLAGGLDFNSLWSAKYSAVGGAAASSVEGAQSLYFNPAGLAKSSNTEFDLNYTSAFTKRSAPFVSTPVTSSISYAPILALFSSQKVTEKLGLGAGAYVAGGNGGKFENVDFGSSFPTLKPEVYGAVVLIEFAAGAGYEIAPDLSVGAAWRPTYLKLNTKAAAALDPNLDGNPDALIAPELDASDTMLNSFRFGIQYQPKDAGWGLGVSMRTELNFQAEGEVSGISQLSGDSTVSPITGGKVVASAKVPLQVVLGAHRDFSDRVRLMIQYDYIHSSVDRELRLSGDSLVVNGLGSLPASSLTLPLKWRNQHTFRFGTQYQATDIWTLRAGYIHSTQVTPNENAHPTFTPPGSENSYLVGAARPIQLFSRPCSLDLAFEYVRSAGVGVGSEPGSVDGKYTTQAIGIYSAVSYRL